jgi:hypothetical protein
MALFAQVNKDGDFQIWTRYFLKKHFAPTWSATLYSELRWGDDASTLYLVIGQIQGTYSPLSWLSLSPAYRQSWRRFPLDSSHWEPEYRPMFDLTFKTPFAGWQISDRNRVEYIIFRSDPEHWVYRNRLRFVLPWSFAYRIFNPFIDNEIFIRQRLGFHEDRLSAGFLSLIYENLGGQIYYMARFQKAAAGWIHQNILVLSLLLAF